MIKLARWEKRLLPLSLITTKAEAKFIVERNKGLLEAVRKNVVRRGDIGCPHCTSDNFDFNCGDCRWWQIKSSAKRPCLYFRFNGVSLNSVAKNDSPLSGEGIRFSVNSETYHPTINMALRKKIFIFLKAHIKWGQKIIGGTYKRYAEQEA